MEYGSLIGRQLTASHAHGSDPMTCKYAYAGHWQLIHVYYFPLEYQRPSYQMRRVVIPPSYVQVASELEMCDLQTGIEALAANHGAQSETQRIEQQEMSFNKRPSPVSPVLVAFSFSNFFSCHLGITEACFPQLSSLGRD